LLVFSVHYFVSALSLVSYVHRYVPSSLVRVPRTERKILRNTHYFLSTTLSLLTYSSVTYMGTCLPHSFAFLVLNENYFAIFLSVCRLRYYCIVSRLCDETLINAFSFSRFEIVVNHPSCSVLTSD